ncbi:leucine-rich repeat domain-containing protein [Listeria rocourtiae]|uniref:leucine-rich repeat domain-containing protein n=1 Tax=Listeria rocourtiae TaxID=647910 RepID=UPI003D2F938E
MKKNMIVISMLASLLITLGVFSTPSFAKTVTTKSEETLTFQTAFPDSALAKAVYLSIYPEQTVHEVDLTKKVTQKELSHIQTLADTRDVPVSDITGINRLTALKTVAFEGNEGGRIVDISLLKHLKKLESLTLRNQFISDLAPLASMKQLKELDLSQNKITNIHALTELTQLKKLNLSGNQITDFRPLEDVAVTHTQAFQALAQTIIKGSTSRVGRQMAIPQVYDTTGKMLSPQVVEGYGNLIKDNAVRWLQPGQSTLQYVDQQKNPAIVVFIQYKTTGNTLKAPKLSKKKLASSSPLIIKDADGKILNHTDYLLAPGSEGVTITNNSQAIADAISLLAQQPFDANNHKGSISLPSGEWHLMNKIELLEGQSLLGNQTTLVRVKESFKNEPIESRDSVNYYDAMIDMASYSRVSGITLDGLKSAEDTADSIQNGITAKGHYTEGDIPTAPSDADYLHDLIIEDTTIQNMAGSGITIDLAKNVTIQGSTVLSDANHAMRVINMGYDGIIGYSVDKMTIDRTLTKTIGHLRRPNQNYSLCQSMRKMQVNNPGHTYQIRYPVSHQGIISNNVVLDNAYEGIDGHSVQDYHISNNTVVGVSQAIIVGGQNYSSAYYYPARDVVITDNRVNQSEDIKKWVGDLEKPSQAGIVLWGATQKTPDGPGSEEVGYSNGEISKNKLDNIHPTTEKTGFYGGIAIKSSRRSR